MNRLYAMPLTHLPAHGIQSLPEERKQRALACRDERTQRQLVGAGLLLQRALEKNGVPTAEQIFDRTELGKPFLKHRKDLHFSLSHGREWAVCAVSDHPVGVDVELPRCTMELARRFFHPEEVSALEPLEKEEQKDRLCRLWTAKEAFVKALGGGLTIPLDSFVVELSSANGILQQNLSPLPYELHQYRLGQSCLSLCAVGERPELITL